MNPISTAESQSIFPLPQPPLLKAFGRFFSYVFHPLFVPAYVAAYLLFIHPYSFALLNTPQKIFRLIFVFSTTAFFPAFTVFLLWRLKFANSIFLRTQKERIIPFVASITYYFWAYFVSRGLEDSPKIMTAFFFGIFLSASAALTANNYFKISMHAIGVGGAATYLILLGLISGVPMGVAIAVATLVMGLVCTSRLLVSDHDPMEIVWGLIVGIAGQVLGCLFILS